MRTRISTTWLTRCFYPRRFLLSLGALALATFVAGVHPQVAFAQFSSPGGGVDDSNGVFQLEGNATTDTGICFQVSPPLIATPGAGNSCPSGLTFVAFGLQTDDWANIFTGVSLHAVATTGIVTDVTNSTSDNIFTGGGAKDTNGLQSGPWLWKNGKPQGKDDIAHAYAAAYSRSSDDHTLIYFGMDRFDNSGDATAGFWFFQDSTVGLGGAKSGSGTHFTGQHMDGDLLIVSDFSIGGAVSTIEVFKWVGSDATGSLVSEATLTTNATCDPISGSSGVCSIVNPVPVPTGGWGFTNKRGANSFDTGEFLEGGIDLNAIFGNNIPCFTTFMAETRSSTSPTSTLSDFSPPASFPLCGIKVSKSCNGFGTVSNGGNTVSYSWTVTATNTGIGKLFDVTVVDTLPDGTTQNISLINESTTPNFLGPKLSKSETVSFTVTCSAGVCTGSGGGSVSHPLSVTNTADVHAFTQPNSGGTEIFPKPDVPQTSTCTASAPGSLKVTKHCDATHGGPVLVSKNGFVVVDVPFIATVCNNEPVGTGEAIANITLSDSPTADMLSPSSISSLAPGACANVTGDYFPSAVDTGSNGLISGRFFFTDTLTASGTGAIGGDAVSNSGSVSCPICPDSECTGQPLP